jgi:hypothetical protein
MRTVGIRQWPASRAAVAPRLNSAHGQGKLHVALCLEVVMRLIRLEDVTPDMHLELDYSEPTPEKLAEVYRLAREQFTAADLAVFCQIYTDDVDAMEFLREMEDEQRLHDEKST